MTELDDRTDDRLRAALGALGDAAQQRIHPAGVEAVPAAGRRRHRAVLAARVALAVLLVGVLATGWRIVRDGAPADRVGAQGCVPATGRAFLPPSAAEDLRTRVGTALANASGVSSASYESREEAYRRFVDLYRDSPELVEQVKPEDMPDAWIFTLRCASAYPAVREVLAAFRGVEVMCSCEPRRSGRPTSVRDIPSR